MLRGKDALSVRGRTGESRALYRIGNEVGSVPKLRQTVLSKRYLVLRLCWGHTQR